MISRSALVKVGCILLLIWAIVATVYAVKNKNSNNICSESLRTVNQGLDKCFQFCGSKGAWASGQINAESACILKFLNTQNVITCPNPSTDYPKLVECAVASIAQENSYWDMSNPHNALSATAAIIRASEACLPGSTCVDDNLRSRLTK